MSGSHIELSNGLIIGKTNTPLDVRTRIESLAGVGDIENPFVGLIFYSLAEERHFKVKSLKPKQIGALEVPDAAIDEYELIASGNEREHRFTHADIDSLNRTYTISGTSHIFGVIDESGRQYPFALDEVTYDSDSTTVSLAAVMTYRNLAVLPGEWQLVFSGGTSGKDGKNFEPDAKGLSADRSQHDHEAKGFSFLDFEAGIMYFKKSSADGDWTDGFPIRAEKGDAGNINVVISSDEPENPADGLIWIQE